MDQAKSRSGKGTSAKNKNKKPKMTDVGKLKVTAGEVIVGDGPYWMAVSHLSRTW